jgi:hypothetical protein
MIVAWFVLHKLIYLTLSELSYTKWFILHPSDLSYIKWFISNTPSDLSYTK